MLVRPDMSDSPIDIKSIASMTNDDIEALVHNIRERRMKPIRDYEEMTEMRRLALKEGLEKQFDKQIEMFTKELERANRAVDKLEERSIKLRALRMQIADV
jgi:2-hydroxychromene-2-carboxylate isomerase